MKMNDRWDGYYRAVGGLQYHQVLRHVKRANRARNFIFRFGAVRH